MTDYEITAEDAENAEAGKDEYKRDKNCILCVLRVLCGEIGLIK